MNDVLNTDDLAKVTGAKQISGQMEILAREKIHHWLGKDGTLKTTWYHVHHPLIDTGNNNVVVTPDMSKAL